MWQNGKRIVGMWAINQNRNCWVYVDGLGWRKLARNDDSIFDAMLACANQAKTGNRNVNFREVGVDGNIEIHEMYVSSPLSRSR